MYYYYYNISPCSTFSFALEHKLLFRNTVGLSRAMPKYGPPYMHMTSLTLSAHGAVFPSLVSPFHCKVETTDTIDFQQLPVPFFFCSFFLLTSVAV